MKLSFAELATMRAEHVEHPPLQEVLGMVAYCAGCYDNWPCDAAKLLAHFAPGPVPHLAGIEAGLFGPRDESDLRRKDTGIDPAHVARAIGRVE